MKYPPRGSTKDGSILREYLEGGIAHERKWSAGRVRMHNKAHRRGSEAKRGC
jgi:hypothetical protein